MPTQTSEVNTMAYSQYIPQDYNAVSQCPPPLPDNWIKMNFRNSKVDGINLAKDAEKLCKKVVEDVKNGKTILPPPLVKDDQARPIITSPDDNTTYHRVEIIPETGSKSIMATSSAQTFSVNIIAWIIGISIFLI